MKGERKEGHAAQSKVRIQLKVFGDGERINYCLQQFFWVFVYHPFLDLFGTVNIIEYSIHAHISDE